MSINICIAEIILGEATCKTNFDCGMNHICKDGTCACREEDGVLSDDKHLCRRKDKTWSMFSWSPKCALEYMQQSLN